MTAQELEQLVEATVRAVLQQLGRGESRPTGPRVRILIDDTDAGLEAALLALAPLTASHRVEYVLTSGQRSQVSLGYVRERAGGAAVRPEGEVGCPLRWAREADVVVAATLARPTAVRVALTLAETFAAKLLLEALSLGRPTLFATDGLGLEAPGATPQLRAALAEPVDRLGVYGAVGAPAAELGAAVAEALAGPGFNAAANRPLITAEQVEAAEGELTLPAGAIVTPLALDRARELGVILRRLPH